jgi:hypothetical protein
MQNEANSEDSAQEQRPYTDGRALSLANLKPFPKGVSGIPGGRPAGQSLTAELRRQLEQGFTMQQIAKALLDKAVSGDIQALRIVFERIDGDVKRAMDLEIKSANADPSKLSDPELARLYLAELALKGPNCGLRARNPADTPQSVVGTEPQQKAAS